MTTLATTLPHRPRFRGMMQILRFNWPRYAGAAAVLMSVGVGTSAFPLPTWGRATLTIGASLAGFWVMASLVVSHVVYDRSRLNRWDWVPLLFDDQPAEWVNVHAGFDESTDALRQLMPGTSARVLDIYDATEMGEPSIRRARRANPGPPAQRADCRYLPLSDNSIDAAFCLLSAHEIRRADARAAFFRELRRAVRSGGRVIVAEHLRDPANFIAFDPGAFHFHSRRTWFRAFRAGGFVIERTFRITPFVAVFVLRRPS